MLRPAVVFALMTLRAFQAARNGEQRRLQVEMMSTGEFALLWRGAVPTRVATQQEAIA